MKNVIYFRFLNRISLFHKLLLLFGVGVILPFGIQTFVYEEGWLVAAPFATMGEDLKEKGYQSLKEISATYYCVNHGTDISAEIHEALEMQLKADGSILLADGAKGNWTLEKGTDFVTITINDVAYSGVIIEMKDEAGNAVRCITASGNNNESIWTVFINSDI